MPISGIGSGMSVYAMQQSRAKAQAQQFAGVISSVPSSKTADTVSANAPAMGNQASSKPDFTAMTPAQFRAEMKGMYDRGEIGADTFFSGATLRTYTQDDSSFGAVGNGKFDYVKIFEDSRRFALSHGGSAAEVQNYDKILKAIGL